MSELRPLVVACASRALQAAPLRRFFSAQGMMVEVAPRPASLEALLDRGAVQLILLDSTSDRLELEAFLDVISSREAYRFVPVLLLGRGGASDWIRARLKGQIAVRVVDVESERELFGEGEREAHAGLRRHSRVPVRLRVRVYLSNGREMVVQSHDISEEGIGLVTERDEMELGDTTRVDFLLPRGSERFHLDAEVRRSVSLPGGGQFLGMWFCDLTRHDRDRLRSFVTSELPA